jgi:hypothetical protein
MRTYWIDAHVFLRIETNHEVTGARRNRRADPGFFPATEAGGPSHGV